MRPAGELSHQFVTPSLRLQDLVPGRPHPRMTDLRKGDRLRGEASARSDQWSEELAVDEVSDAEPQEEEQGETWVGPPTTISHGSMKCASAPPMPRVGCRQTGSGCPHGVQGSSPESVLSIHGVDCGSVGTLAYDQHWPRSTDDLTFQTPRPGCRSQMSSEASAHQPGGLGAGSIIGFAVDGPWTGCGASFTCACRTTTASAVTLKTVRSWQTATAPP
jgi:hypothetical protein